MPEFAVYVLSTAAVSTALSATLFWLAKSWISERLRGAIQHEYNEKLESHKAQLKAQSDVDSEKLKSQLQISLNEHQVRFSGLHNKRAEVISEVYKLLVQAYWDTYSFANPAEFAGEPDKREKYRLAMGSMNAFYLYFDKNRIYVPENICLTFERFIQEMRGKAVGFGIFVHYDDANIPDEAIRRKHDAWEAAWQHIDKVVPTMRISLEKELRTLLGDR